MKTLILLASALLALAPKMDFTEAVLRICGAACIEDLDESTLERFRSLEERPLDLNTASRSRLLASGLMNAFQVASLMEYRSRSGDLLSFAELSLVEGFTEEYVAALRLFATLGNPSSPGKRESGRLRHDLMLRGSARTDGEKGEAAYGARYKIAYGERLELTWASRVTYADGTPGIGTVSAAYYGRKALGKLILGHFNARFGQGLALWSGFTMSPYGSVGALCRSSTGLSSTSSFNPELCGIAADFELGRFSIAAGYSFAGKMPLAAVSYTSRSFTAGMTATSEAVSADWRIGIPNASLYGEAAWNGGFLCNCGIMWVPAYGWKTGALLRLKGAAPELIAGLGGPGLDLVLAASNEQLRGMLKWAPSLNINTLVIKPSLRAAARHKGKWRLEGRGELDLLWSGWLLHARGDLVWTDGLSWLVNAEAGKTEGKWRAWLRYTRFKVDSWDGRIYVYERDAPGNFNVPAYYGNGHALALYTGLKFNRSHSLYLRMSYIGYPWMNGSNPPRAEVKLQYQLKL